MSLETPREDVEVMRSHGWQAMGSGTFLYFDYRFASDERVPPNPHNGVATLNMKVEYVARLMLIQNIVLPRTWKLSLRRVTYKDGEQVPVDYYPDPVTCSVELKLLGGGDIGKGVEELLRDKLSAYKS